MLISAARRSGVCLQDPIGRRYELRIKFLASGSGLAGIVATAPRLPVMTNEKGSSREVRNQSRPEAVGAVARHLPAEQVGPVPLVAVFAAPGP